MIQNIFSIVSCNLLKVHFNKVTRIGRVNEGLLVFCIVDFNIFFFKPLQIV